MPRGNDYPLDSRLRAARGQPADRPTSTDGVGGDSPTGAIEDMTGRAG